MKRGQTQPLAPWNLDGVDCPRCGNRGCLVRVDEDGVVWARECGCMPLRRALRVLQLHGEEMRNPHQQTNEPNTESIF